MELVNVWYYTGGATEDKGNIFLETPLIMVFSGITENIFPCHFLYNVTWCSSPKTRPLKWQNKTSTKMPNFAILTKLLDAEPSFFSTKISLT